MVNQAIGVIIAYVIGFGSGGVSGILVLKLLTERYREYKAHFRNEISLPLPNSSPVFSAPPLPNSSPVFSGLSRETSIVELMASRYFVAGLILISTGAAISILSYLILRSIPLAALGLACIILGFTSATLPSEVTGSTSMKFLLNGAIQNAETILREVAYVNKTVRRVRREGMILSAEPLLEDDSLRTAAVYLPPKEGLVGVFLPLGSNVGTGDIEAMWNAPRVVTYDDQRGLLIFPVGAAIGEMLSRDGDYSDLEESLQRVIVHSAELCSGVTVSEVEKTVIVKFTGVKVQADSSLCSSVLGSIPTSIAGCVICSSKMRPAIILDELIDKNSTLARFKVE